MISITLAIVIAVVVAAIAAVAAVMYCRHHTDKCDARIEGILSEKALEISEPMTMVIGPLSMLIKKEPTGTSNRRMLQIAMANAERVSSIMGLDLSKDARKSAGKRNDGGSNAKADVNADAQRTDADASSDMTQSTDATEVYQEWQGISDSIGEAVDDANSFLEKAQGVVNDHIDDSSFDKDTFAVEMYVSPSTLYKKIKQLSGLSPSDYIKEIRLSRALSLVEETDLPISVISDMCGFSTVAYFGYSFRKRYGIAPTEKRKETKE